MHRSEKPSALWLLIGTAFVALILSLVALILAFAGRGPAGPGGWLRGAQSEKFDTLAYHQRGLDQAMWEVGYRYRELAWAGEQEDWGYAQYQMDKMKLTLEQAIERRPARAVNTRLFFEEGVEPMLRALKQNPGDNLSPRLELLKAACVNCHAREEAPIVKLDAWMRRED